MKLNGRTALITGGGSGVGRAIAFRFASEGCHVALADSNDETATAASREIALTGNRAMAVHMDVSDEASVTRGVERVVEKLGHVDILANVAAIWIGGSVTEIAIADWDRVIA